jgi:hypothetical protein
MHDEIPSTAVRGPSLLRRITARQWKLIGAAAVAVVVVIVVVGVLIGGKGGKSTEKDLRDRLSQVVADARHQADQVPDRQIDVAKLNRTLDKERSGWNVDLAASQDRHSVGVAARQPDGTTCIFVWSVVGGSKSATVTDPALPCVGQIALIAAA